MININSIGDNPKEVASYSKQLAAMELHSAKGKDSTDIYSNHQSSYCVLHVGVGDLGL